MECTGLHIMLRLSTMDDLPLMAKWAADEEVMRHVVNRTFTYEEEKIWLETALADPNLVQFTIVLHKTAQPIGSCGIHMKNPKPRHAHREGVEVGLLIGEKEEWGKGYGTEAVQLMTEYARDILHVPCVWLLVNAVHERAQKAYVKTGFVVTEKSINPDRTGQGSEQLVMERRF
ncbi:MAG: hypothetical protein JWM56_724 [Candidatus Peribacteria bacterium]|nr:hypothetical protein [Candidatus Peribacteria bacterium]